MARKKTFKMRLSEAEHAQLTDVAIEHGMPMADIVRILTLGPEAADRLPSRDLLKQILRQLTGISTNLNQAQKAINEASKADILNEAQVAEMYKAIAVGHKNWVEPKDQLIKFMKR